MKIAVAKFALKEINYMLNNRIYFNELKEIT